MTDHGVESVMWDNIGVGYRLTCLCGWTSDLSEKVQWVGIDFDDHLREVNLSKMESEGE